jgi:hypothetical protein
VVFLFAIWVYPFLSNPVVSSSAVLSHFLPEVYSFLECPKMKACCNKSGTYERYNDTSKALYCSLCGDLIKVLPRGLTLADAKSSVVVLGKNCGKRYGDLCDEDLKYLANIGGREAIISGMILCERSRLAR